MTGVSFTRIGSREGVVRSALARRVSMCGCVVAALLAGCEAQQTNIVSMTRYPDGTEVRYSNTSSGYGYNPNVTVDVRSHTDPRMSPAAPAAPAVNSAEYSHGALPTSGPATPAAPAAPAAPATSTPAPGTVGWGYGGGYQTVPVTTVPVTVAPAPIIVPVYMGGYWGQPAWGGAAYGGTAWGAGMPGAPGAFGAGVYGPPLPNFGFGYR